MTTTATRELTDEYKRESFLDWYNNYVSTERFAEHYSLTIEEANTLIKEGRELHEAAVVDQPDRKAAIERGRKFHQERIAWLSASVPKFACGTPVDAGIKEQLLTQSKQRLAGPECLLAWDAYNEPSLVRITALKKMIADRKGSA
jgi:predicted RNA-binding protein (virulence factor B family)